MPSKPRFDTAGLRKLVRQRVDESSLRFVADEIGVSKSGLDSFLKGREPYSRTRAKLAAWSVRQRHPGIGAIPREEVEAAIAVLERYVQSVGSKAGRERRVREVAARLTRAE